jgi:hypothetical protein
VSAVESDSVLGANADLVIETSTVAALALPAAVSGSARTAPMAIFHMA